MSFTPLAIIRWTSNTVRGGDNNQITNDDVIYLSNPSWPLNAEFVSGGNNVESVTLFFLGDVNEDELVNLLDVEPFIDMISNGQFQDQADMNRDGVVNLLDVEPFIAALSGSQ